MSVNNLFDENELHAYLSEKINELKSDEYLGLRILSKKKLTGLYNNIESAMKDIKAHSGHAQIFCSLNPIKLVTGLAINCLSTGFSFGDDDVARITTIFIDIDPEREKQSMANDQEIAAAYQVTTAIMDYLESNEVLYDFYFSGNGYHLLLKVPSYSTEKSEEIKYLLGFLASKFSNDEAKVDTGVFNPSRICRVYGTLNMKGVPSNERPHRMAKKISSAKEASKILDVLEIFKKEIEEFNIGKEHSASNSQYKSKIDHPKLGFAKFKGDIKTLDLVGLFKEAQLYVKPMQRPKHIALCPNREKHSDNTDKTSSTIIFESNENSVWPGFNCKHNHCQHLSLPFVLNEYFQPELVDKFCRNQFAGCSVQNDYHGPPEPLFREIPKSKPFPTKALGRLAPVAKVFAEAIQAPDAIIGQSLIAAAALAVQPHANVDVDGRQIPLSTFCCSVAASGERKSATDSEVLFSHRKYEQELMEKHADELVEYHRQIAEHTQKNKSKNSKKGDPAAREEQNIELPPTAPSSKMMMVAEPTYEGLAKSFINGRPTLGLFSDEAAQFLGGYAMNKDNFLKTSAALSNLWGDKPISIMRAKDVPVKIYGRRLSMHLMFQPKILNLLTANELIADQGLLSRCLIVFPESNIGKRKYNHTNLNENSEVKAYRKLMYDILSFPLQIDSKLNSLMFRSIHLKPEVKEIWVEWYNRVESMQSEGGEFFNIRGFASKAPELALRLAGVFALVDDIMAQFISEENLLNGIELIEFYLSEATRVHNASILNPDLLMAQKLLNWCQRHTEIDVVSIYQFGPSGCREKEIAEKLIEILASHNWLIPIQGGKVIDGSHRRKVWRVVKCDQLQ
jgi:hypothetical protein